MLARELGRASPSLIVVYGRRRVGKSTLILRALGGRAHVYFHATRVTDPDVQELFRRQIASAVGAAPVLDGLTGWEALLGHLQRLAEARRPGLTVVLDEFRTFARRTARSRRSCRRCGTARGRRGVHSTSSSAAPRSASWRSCSPSATRSAAASRRSWTSVPCRIVKRRRSSRRSAWRIGCAPSRMAARAGRRS